LVERDALANPAQTEAPAQLAAGTGGIVTYTDTNAALLPRRFYPFFER
jgi:hypothetical protein